LPPNAASGSFCGFVEAPLKLAAPGAGLPLMAASADGVSICGAGACWVGRQKGSSNIELGLPEGGAKPWNGSACTGAARTAPAACCSATKVKRPIWPVSPGASTTDSPALNSPRGVVTPLTFDSTVTFTPPASHCRLTCLREMSRSWSGR
jgi:hypothetical protein